MKEQIKQNFLSGYYKENELTEIDAYYIVNDEELKQLFFDFFYSQDVFKASIKAYYSLCDEVIPNEYYRVKDDIELSRKMMYQFMKFDISSFGGFAIESIYECMNFFGLENEKDEVIKFVLDYIKDKSITIKPTEKTIEFLLDRKEYTLFDRLKPDSVTISSKLLERLKEDMLKKEFNLPSAIRAKLDLPTNEYTLEELIIRCKEIWDFSSITVTPRQSDYIKRLKELIDNSDYEEIKNQMDVMLDFEKSSSISDKFSKILNNDEMLSLFKTGYISFNVIENIINKQILKSNEFSEIVLDLVRSSDNPEKIIESLESSFVPKDYLQDLYNKLIDEGYGLLLVNYKLADYQIKKIEELFYSEKNKITTISELSNIEDIDINFLSFILNNCKISSFNYQRKYSSYQNLLFKNINESDESEKTIGIEEKVDLISKYINKNSDTKIKMFDFFDKNIFDFWYKQKNYYFLASSIINIVSANNLSEDFLLWLDGHSDDIFLFHTIIKSYMFSSCYKEEMFRSVMDNSIIVSELIESIIHNDNIIEKFNDSFYEKVKNALAKKYSLDVNKMDLLEKHFGPNIVMYIGDSNIHKILNLDIEKINKLLLIFPKLDYSLIDVEAAYESINQYRFGKEPNNTKVIDIFPNILHAAKNNNAKLLQEYKYIILTIIDLRVIESIMEKNGFNGSPLDYINYLFDNLTENNVNILHEITNNTILSERKFYRNNHYYMQENSYDIKIEVSKCFKDFDYLLFETIRSIPVDFIKDIFKKFGIENGDEFKSLLSSPNEEDIIKYKAVIEAFVRKKINDLRENKPIGYSMFDELGLPYELDERKKKLEIERSFLKGINSYIGDLKPKLLAEGIPENIIDRIVECFGLGDFSYISDETKEYVGVFTKVAMKFIRESIEKQDIGFEKSYINNITPALDKEKKIKRIYRINKAKDLYPVLVDLNIDLMEKNIFSDEEIYSLLVEIMKNKKIHLLDSAFYEAFKDGSINVLDDVTSLAGFINFFKVIVEKTNISIDDKDKIISHFSIIEILRQASTYSSMSSIYSSILGAEDARLIKANPGPNSAKTKDTKKRFEEAVKDTLICFNKQNISIPTLDTIVPLKDDKFLEVIVGNFTSPCNLTHGERTGACMRIGGAGEELYQFCINSENGFHIRFEDPKTHKYISRVSGFRNGNTVFLNQLRSSLDKRYTDSDLIKATKEIARMLIEMTKDSDNPIENVFVTNGYAMEKCKDERYKLDSDEITKGLGKIYTDYSYSSAYLLATTASKDYVPIRTKKVSSTYPVQRTKPKIIIDDLETAPNYVNRVHTINQLLQGKKLEDDEIDVFEFENEVLYCVVNDDWYIYVDNNYEIKSEYISKDPRAKEELDKYKVIVEEMIQKGLVKEKAHEL